MVCPNNKKVFYLNKKDKKKAQEKIAQDKNNLSNLFHGQAQEEYYLIGTNIILMTLYFNSLFPLFES